MSDRWGANDTWNVVAERMGHTLRRDGDGSVDIFALSAGSHNGPKCETCEEAWCHHCTPPGEIKACAGKAAGPTAIHTRATLHARIADVLRRSGVADAEQLVRLMEQDASEIVEMLKHGEAATRRTAAEWRAFGDNDKADPLYKRAERIARAILGAEIGPPK